MATPCRANHWVNSPQPTLSRDGFESALQVLPGNYGDDLPPKPEFSRRENSKAAVRSRTGNSRSTPKPGAPRLSRSFALPAPASLADRETCRSGWRPGRRPVPNQSSARRESPNGEHPKRAAFVRALRRAAQACRPDNSCIAQCQDPSAFILGLLASLTVTRQAVRFLGQ